MKRYMITCTVFEEIDPEEQEEGEWVRFEEAAHRIGLLETVLVGNALCPKTRELVSRCVFASDKPCDCAIGRVLNDDPK